MIGFYYIITILGGYGYLIASSIQNRPAAGILLTLALVSLPLAWAAIRAGTRNKGIQVLATPIVGLVFAAALRGAAFAFGIV